MLLSYQIFIIVVYYMEEEQAELFTETERRGLLGKVISILDHGFDMTDVEDTVDVKRLITETFTKKEFKMVINKINECEPNTFINHSMQNEGNCMKLFRYMRRWRLRYWNGEDMSGFMCGMIGNIRKKREKTINKFVSYIADKTTDDTALHMKGYLKGGTKRRKYRKRRSNKRRSIKKKRF